MSAAFGTGRAAGSRAVDEARAPYVALMLVSLALLAVRLYAAGAVGFGDSEALYASYALHPQAAYLDHPGLVGLLARALGHGSAPTPEAAHIATSFAATILPWVAAWAARMGGASRRGALLAALIIAVTPEIAVGLFAMTPDLPLAFAWLGALGLAAAGLRARPSSGAAAAALVFAGLLAGVACATKVSGLLLAAALVFTYADRAARPHAKTIWPWVGIACGALVAAPFALFEAHAHFPMLRHRLIDTQPGSGVSLRNLGALLGGQLAYVSPVLLVLAFLAARHLSRVRRDDPHDAVAHLHFAAFLVPFVPLVALSLWSRTAEPHWVAPAFLALPLHAARFGGAFSRKIVAWSVGTGAGLVAFAHAWVLVPASVRLVPEAQMRFDIANELYGWPRAITAAREVISESSTHDPPDPPVLVGPYWTICAQLSAALGDDAPVGCDDPVRDDFDDWLPREMWHHAEAILYVTDDRFPTDLTVRFPGRFAERIWHVPVSRGGRLIRTFQLALLVPRAVGALDAPSDGYSAGAIARSPASRISERSASSSGLGVVRSFSP